VLSTNPSDQYHNDTIPEAEEKGFIEEFKMITEECGKIWPPKSKGKELIFVVG
jgi:hypothetical protein